MKWFRFYHEFVDDPKIAMMSDSDQLLWVKALCLASESNQRGYILLSDEQICWKLRVTVETWKHAIDKLRAKGMIEHCEGGYRIVNWDKRQFKSDSSAERVAEHRAKNKPADPPKKKKKSTPKEEKRFCNVTSNGIETPSDPETDPEIRTENRINTLSDPCEREEVEQVNQEPDQGSCHNLGQLLPPVTHSPVNNSPVVSHHPARCDRSAGPVENWDIEAKEWACHYADWRESITDYKDEMLQAVADNHKGCEFTVTGNGGRNDYLIGKHIAKLEEKARYYYGEPSQINARANLLKLWKSAQAIANRKTAAQQATPLEFASVVVQPIEDTREAQIARLKAMLKLPNMRQQAITRAQQFGISLAELGEAVSA